MRNQTLCSSQQEAQENSDEITCLQRQVSALTQQVRQQQQKIAELKHQATSPSVIITALIFLLNGHHRERKNSLPFKGG